METPISEIFDKNRNHYLDQIAKLDFDAIKDTLGLLSYREQYALSFFNQIYEVGKEGIRDADGNQPDYMAHVILSKYLLLCPENPSRDTQWCAFREFKKTSHFTNINYFSSDTERAMTRAFAGRRNHVIEACEILNGIPMPGAFTYDLVYRFEALPRISLLLLYNDGDEDFDAYGTVLFQRRAEDYLDPESLAGTSAFLVKRLIEAMDAST